MLLLAIKALLSPLLLATCALVGRRWGMSVAGMMLGLPLVSGPVSALLLTQYGVGFAESAARGTLVGFVAAGVFCVSYGRIADSTRWWQSLPVAIGACLGAAYLLSRIHLGLGDSVLLVAALLMLLAMAADAPSSKSRPPTTSKRGLGLRMAIASVVVIGLTTSASVLGSQLAGMLATAPVVVAIMATTSHRRSGSDSAKGLLRGTVVGLWGGAAFFTVVAAFVTIAPPVLTYVAATAAAVAVGVAAGRIAHSRSTAHSQRPATA
jgi:hypothetical protein